MLLLVMPCRAVDRSIDLECGAPRSSLADVFERRPATDGSIEWYPRATPPVVYDCGGGGESIEVSVWRACCVTKAQRDGEHPTQEETACAESSLERRDNRIRRRLGESEHERTCLWFVCGSLTHLHGNDQSIVSPLPDGRGGQGMD